ncbi:MAG: TetR/AcrR family transcriptional regulator [Leucobacter sp.]
MREQLGEQGYAALTIEGVAAKSGVAKTTIYRRWRSKAEMVFDLAIHRADEVTTFDTGSLKGDLEVLAERAVRLVSDDPGRSVLPGLLADMAGDPDLTDRLRESFVGAARADIAAMLDRALARGELREAADVELVHAALLGIPYAQVHLLGLRDAALLRRAVLSGVTAMLPAANSN